MKTLNTVRLLETMKNYNGEDRMINFGELVEERKGQMDPASYNTQMMPGLDQMSEGIEEGEIVIIGGGSGEGKTLLMLSLIAAFDKQGLTTSLFEFEQTEAQIYKKFKQKPPNFFVPATMDPEVKYDPFIEQLKKDNSTFIGRLPGVYLQWLYLKIVEMTAKGNKPQAIFIDYIHSLMDFKVNNAVNAIGDIMRALQAIAKQHKIMIFIIAHTTKEAADLEPRLTHLRDSGWIINVPDIILLLWRQMDEITGEYSPISTLKIAKHRRIGGIKGKKISLSLTWDELLTEYREEEQGELT